jgi:hypothetical protein
MIRAAEFVGSLPLSRALLMGSRRGRLAASVVDAASCSLTANAVLDLRIFARNILPNNRGRTKLMSTRDVVTGAAVGAALLFVLDPNQGAKRRAMLRDKLRRAGRLAGEGASATARDMSHRARGVAASVRGRLSDENVSDDVVCERVRAKLGRASSHAGALDVDVRHGCVTLRGPILSSEVRGVLAVASAVRGVQGVVDELEPHDTAAGIPSLQGAGRVAQPALDILQRRWTPATRTLVSAGALAIGAWAAAHARQPRHYPPTGAVV